MMSDKSKKQGSIVSALKLIDIYGEGVNFTIRDGQTSFGSLTGSLISILIFTLTLVFAVQKFIVLKERDDTNYTLREFPFQDKNEEQMATDIGFDLMFQVFNPGSFQQAQYNPVEPEEMDSYMSVSARVFEYDVNDAVQEVKPLEYQRCSQQQVLVKQAQGHLEQPIEMVEKFNCLRDDALKELSFLGDSNALKGKNIVFSIDHCRNSTERASVCKSEEEIINFMDGKFFSLIIKTKSLDVNVYGEGQIQSHWAYKELVYNPRLKQQIWYSIQKQVLQSDHQFYSLGLFSEREEFFHLKDEGNFAQASGDLFPTMNIFFVLDRDEVHHERQIYSPLDFLGDVGGLADALNAIGFVILKVIQMVSGGSGLSMFLISSIFKVDNSQKLKDLPLTDKIYHVINKRPFKLSKGPFWCGQRDKRKLFAEKIAQAEIAKELDIVQFIKSQKVVRMALEVLFSRVELQLIKNNKYLALKRKYDDAEDRSMSTDCEVKLESDPGPRLKWLYQRTQLRQQADSGDRDEARTDQTEQFSLDALVQAKFRRNTGKSKVRQTGQET